MKKTIILLLSIILNITLISVFIFEKKSENNKIEEQEICDNLSEWQMFTLALMKVESDYDNSAVSSAGAMGYFQMTPIYVKEVNRVYGTNYEFSDVTDFNKAFKIFDLMQQAHNPNYDMKKALELHNGKHNWYNKRVFKAMDELKVYEEMRSLVKNI